MNKYTKCDVCKAEMFFCGVGDQLPDGCHTILVDDTYRNSVKVCSDKCAAEFFLKRMQNTLAAPAWVPYWNRFIELVRGITK